MNRYCSTTSYLGLELSDWQKPNHGGLQAKIKMMYMGEVSEENANKTQDIDSSGIYNWLYLFYDLAK
ncbi:MAG: hypothetical protein GX306_04700 [Clostridiales bacterium]|jgi:hypothetical protein|nr:hypothetical protein [Clostridiales bacterium]